MKYRERDSVVLLEDIPAQGLRAGDAGAVVHAYSDDDVEVEFIRLSGRTQAVVSLSTRKLRAASDDDLMSARSRSGSV